MIQLKNNAQSMLAYPISGADTTLTVIPEDIGRFPALTVPGDHFYCALADSQGNLEFVRVTGINAQTATLTVVRGVEGTTARGWNTGDRVQLRMSMATWTDMAGDWWQRVKTTAGDALAPTLVSTTSFSLSGDWTGEMQEGRRLKITASDGTQFKGHVASSTLTNGTTSVTVGGDPAPTLAGTLVAVDMGFSTEMESHLTKMRSDSALSSKTAAETSATSASTKASESATSAANALASKNAAAGSATTATSKAGEAATSATDAKASETAALASKNAAATSASTASTKATASAESASAALASQNAAKTSETAAAGSASTATTKAGEAATSATAAKASETAAATSASTASTKAGEASSSASSALTSKNAAATSATTATTKAGEASTSATAAETAKVAAETARDEAQNIAGGNYVIATRKLTAGTGLSGGGDLTADRTLTVKYGTTAGTACQGNDARLTNARTPTAHAETHKYGGSDALATKTPAANAIPQAGTDGKLDAGWFPNAANRHIAESVSGPQPGEFGFRFTAGSVDGEGVDVDGLGRFCWSATSTDPVDSETCLLAAGMTGEQQGRWLLVEPDWQAVFSEILRITDWLELEKDILEQKVTVCFASLSGHDECLSTLTTELETVGHVLTTTATLTFSSIASYGGRQDVTVSLPGVSVGDVVQVDCSMLVEGLFPSGFVVVADVVTVRLMNAKNSAITPASAEYRITAVGVSRSIG